MMHTYRCYLLNGHRHIAAVEVIECRDDGIAKRRAEQILAAQPASAALRSGSGTGACMSSCRATRSSFIEGQMVDRAGAMRRG